MLFFQFFNDTHREDCVLLILVQELIEVEAWLASDHFPMLTQSINCHKSKTTDAWKMWFIK